MEKEGGDGGDGGDGRDGRGAQRGGGGEKEGGGVLDDRLGRPTSKHFHKSRVSKQGSVSRKLGNLNEAHHLLVRRVNCRPCTRRRGFRRMHFHHKKVKNLFVATIAFLKLPVKIRNSEPLSNDISTAEFPKKQYILQNMPPSFPQRDI